MVTCSERELEIEDLRNHSQEMISHLRDVLARGANVIPDAKRPGFYEVKLHGQLYFIYISPKTGKVLLIAGWSREESLHVEVEASA
ncbi:MAG: hypothetical protein WCD49_07865 [Candidatus Acidiferrales bacterium]